MYFYDFRLLLYLAPALILAAVAQWMVHSAYARARQMAAGLRRRGGFWIRLG